MQTITPGPAPTSTQFFFVPNSFVADANSRANASAACSDREFVGMLNSYRNSGGLARLQQLARYGSNGLEVDPSTIAASISQREVICFEWQEHAWLPLFQFDVRDMTPLPQLKVVISELSPDLDPWGQALWFSKPNPWLCDRAPADALLTEFNAVCRAAQADRLFPHDGMKKTL
jgi:hypothetical protein